jgi:hypothetical protein
MSQEMSSGDQTDFMNQKSEMENGKWNMENGK